jgi:stalled ribosome rescue protein Dom34
MAIYVVWMDSEKAELFNLGESGVVKSSVKRKVIDHHTHNKKDHHGDPATEHFFNELMQKLNGVEELLLLGPSLAKAHFKSHLEKHNTRLAGKIVGMESSDHPTDNQILASARKFFKTYNLFHHPVQQAK